MKTILGLVPIALGLAACQTYPYDPYYGGQGPAGYPQPQPYPSPYPAPYPGPPAYQGDYKAVGTEPFWDLTIGRDLVFNDRGMNQTVVQPTPRPTNGFAGEMYDTPRIRVNIVHAECSDGMSDRRFPDRVQVWVDGRQFNGCGAPSSFYSSVGENGYPVQGMPVPMLSQTNWRIVAINGRTVPTSNFYMNFLPDRIGAKFGCNSIGAGYSQNGSTLTATAPTATRMACPDMTFEDQGNKVLAKPMTISATGDRVTLTNVNGSIDLVRAN